MDGLITGAEVTPFPLTCHLKLSVVSEFFSCLNISIFFFFKSIFPRAVLALRYYCIYRWGNVHVIRKTYLMIGQTFYVFIYFIYLFFFLLSSPIHLFLLLCGFLLPPRDIGDLSLSTVRCRTSLSFLPRKHAENDVASRDERFPFNTMDRSPPPPPQQLIR